jgi:hypothetical protein
MRQATLDSSDEVVPFQKFAVVVNVSLLAIVMAWQLLSSAGQGSSYYWLSC